MALFQELPDFVKDRPRTRIVCTIGPATGDRGGVEALIRAGMSVARLNLSHGDREEHAGYVSAIRAVSDEMGVPVGILADLPGPKYRVGSVDASAATDEDGRLGVRVASGGSFVLTSEECYTTDSRAMVWPAGLHRDVGAGSRVLIDEGALELEVESVAGLDVHCRILRGGLIQSDKAVTVPGCTSSLDYFTDETVDALDFAIDADVDFVGLSYIRNAEDMRSVRRRVLDAGRNPLLVAKIEIEEAVNNLGEIMDEADAVMVARGDLGVEMPLHLVPMVQKRMIRMANEIGKPVITATQMLESMRDNPNPTRAEATDVYNAVRDGTDAVMLSAETSVGNYPIEAVRFMTRVSKLAEQFLETEMLRDRRMKVVLSEGRNAQIDSIIAYDAASTADQLESGAIVTFTESGSTAERVASFRPRTPVLALSPTPSIAARLSIRWGIVGLQVSRIRDLNDMFTHALETAKGLNYADDGDSVVVVAGLPVGHSGSTNLLHVIRVT